MFCYQLIDPTHHVPSITIPSHPCHRYILVKDGLSDAAVRERHAAIRAIREVRDFRAQSLADAEDGGFEIVETVLRRPTRAHMPISR